MWRYSDTGEPFDESVLIPPITKHYYHNLDTYLSLYDDETLCTVCTVSKEEPKRSSTGSFLCCFSFNT